MNLTALLSASRQTLPTFALMGIVWSGFHAYAPHIKSVAGADDWGFGLALFASAVGSLITMILAPRFEERLGARTMLICALALIGAFQLIGLVTSFTILIAVMVVLGAAMGLMDVVMNAQVARDEALSGRSLMGLNHGVYSLVYAIAALSAAPLRGAGYGPEIYYLLAALVSVPLIWTVRFVPLTEAETAADAGNARLPSLVLWIGLIVLIGYASENAVESWSALHIERTLGGSPGEGPLGPAALGLTMALGRFSGQALANRFSDAKVLRAGALMAAMGAVIAALAPTPLIAYLGFAAAGLGISVQGPMALALIGRSVPAALRTRAIARGSVIGYTGFFFGPPIIGLVAEYAGLRAAFAVVALALTAIPLIIAATQSNDQPATAG